MQDDVYFQVVADAGADGARPLADIGVGLRAALKQAIRAGKPTHSYIVGHVTYTVDFHSWLVTDSVTHNVRPLRVVARKLAIADQTTPLGDNAPVGAAGETELALGVPVPRVQVRYRDMWVALPVPTGESVLAGGVVTLQHPPAAKDARQEGAKQGDAMQGGAGVPVEEVFIADVANLLLFHQATGHTYPFRVTAGPHAKSPVLRATPVTSVRALGDHWHWGPGTLTKAMRECITARVPVTPQCTPWPGKLPSSEWLPLRAFGSQGIGSSVFDALPMSLTATIMDGPALVASRSARRQDSGVWPFLPDASPALEMQFAMKCGEIVPQPRASPLSPSPTPFVEPMGRVLDPSVPDDMRRIRLVIAYMGCTLRASHVMQIVEIVDPGRLPAMKNVMALRAAQLRRMKTAIDTASVDWERGTPAAAKFARACAESPSAYTGNALMLFHGSRSLQPADVVCQGGPSMDHSSDSSFYGRGIYGSTSAQYVRRSYVHRASNRAGLMSGVCQMLAFVGVAGNTYNAGLARGIRRDAVRGTVVGADPTGGTPLQIHSASGYLNATCNDRNFAFYFDHDVTPAYLITFRPE